LEEKSSTSGNVFDLRVLKRLFSFVKPYRKAFSLLVLTTILLAVLGPLRPYLIQVAIDQYLKVGDMATFNTIMLLLIGLLVVQSLVQFSNTYFAGLVGQHVIRDIRLQLFRHIMRLRLRFFDQTPIGRLVTRNVSDIETLSNVFSDGFANIIGDLLQLVVILGFMLYTDWRLTLVSLSMLPLLIVSTYIFKEKIKHAFNDVRTAVANLNTFVQEHITGMSIVQIFGAEQREYDKFTVINKEHRDANLRSVLYYSIYFPVAEVIGAAGTGLLVWYGSRGALEGVVTEGVLIAFIMYIAMFFRPIRLIADRFNTLQLGVVSTDRIFKLLDNTDTTPDTGIYKPATVSGHIRFEGVWFAYKSEQWVLQDLSFEVPAGKSLALVGHTGAGKSSVIQLITRMYDIQKGNIYLDEVEVRAYSLQNLRRHFGVVLQDVFLYSDSILENIRLGNPDITLEQVVAAAELVGAHRFIERLPGGYAYNVMERGATLSVGQRQLISFVRALVYDPRIIILDEATSSVDTETEAMIQEAIEKMLKGRTALVIAHRLSTIQSADQILVLEKGKIIEQGVHEELLALGGSYAGLHALQFRE
jgi:ATP-binding cassette subfamily B protein